MGDNGLKQSIWASRSKENSNSNLFTRSGDWDCSSCGFSNFLRRTNCMQCSTSRIGAPRDSSPTIKNAQQTFTIPKAINGIAVSNRYQSDTSNTLVPISVSTQNLAQPKLGNTLADSLWAPRNFKGRAKKADTSQVWIRKPSQDYDYSQSKTRAQTTNPKPPTTSPDLGLPYEVQHFILAMMQRLLEEGCYDFAYRWMPGMLNERNWSCPEAVELSVWRGFFPDATPQHALISVPQYSLSQGLRDAVKIRNAAVHRHLCDNSEIRQMAQQAQNLMTMFGDVSRQDKFQRLWEELHSWDRNNKADPQGARGKLEQILLEVNERPMDDDMDWTPNAVSLQEIMPQVEQIQGTVYHEDAMELD